MTERLPSVQATLAVADAFDVLARNLPFMKADKRVIMTASNTLHELVADIEAKLEEAANIIDEPEPEPIEQT